MLCDGCEEVSLGERLPYGDCVFCSEPCFEQWFAGGPARRNAAAAAERSRPDARAALRLVAVTVIAAGAVFLGSEGAQARFFDAAVEPPALTASAACHKRRVIDGRRKRVTVPCGRRRFTDPRTAPHQA